MIAHVLPNNTRHAWTKRSVVPARPAAVARSAFSLTELLVVIGIIVLLASILLVALGQVRASAMKTTTSSTMRGFAAACDSFQQEHGQYPGVIPERVLAQAIRDGQVMNDDSEASGLSSTQNALLHLMGGYRVLRPNASPSEAVAYNEFVTNADGDNLMEYTITAGGAVWQLAIDLTRIGEGPVIDGRAYAPYYTPAPREVGAVEGRVACDGEPLMDRLPTLVDAWGQPILYTRRLRSTGPLVGAPSDEVRPQFVMDGFHPYLLSSQLGSRGESQLLGFGAGSNPTGSILVYNFGSGFSAEHHRLFAQIIRHPAFGPPDVDPLLPQYRERVAPRGEYVLISAGRDGIFFSAADGPGSRVRPIFSSESSYGDALDLIQEGPRIFEEFDDIVIFGGG